MARYYKLGERPSLSELKTCGFVCGDRPWVNPIRQDFSGLVAVKTGERRSPKRGEWFLSGAIIEAYKASNDLDSPYLIAKLVRVRTRLVTDVEH